MILFLVVKFGKQSVRPVVSLILKVSYSENDSVLGACIWIVSQCCQPRVILPLVNESCNVLLHGEVINLHINT